MTKHNSWAKSIDTTLFSFKRESILRQSFDFVSHGGFYKGLNDGSLSEILIGLLRSRQFS